MNMAIRNQKISQIDAKLDELYKLDIDICEIFRKMNHLWVYNKIYVMSHEIEKEVREFFDNYSIVTGSISEYSATSRFFRELKADEPIIALELDTMYCVGEIPMEKVMSLIEPINDNPGYCRLKSEALDFGNPMFFSEYYLQFLTPDDTNNPKQIVKLLRELHSSHHTYLRTDILTEIVGLVIMDGDPKRTNVKRQGPSAECKTSSNCCLQKAADGLAKKILHTNRPIKIYNKISVCDIIQERQLENTDNISKLFNEAFPHNKDTLGVEAIQKIRKLLEISNPMTLGLQLYASLKNFPFIPCIQFYDLGDLSFDNVPCFKLNFWPDAAAKWKDRTNKYWPSHEIFDKIIKNGCYIVPKGIKGGENKNEWRMSFSESEKLLMNSFDEKIRKSYLAAKCIYYAKIKCIDDEAFPSYFLKTITFKTMEKHPAEFWATKSIVDIVAILYKELANSFSNGSLEHIFISTMNILKGVEVQKLKEASQVAFNISQNPYDIYFLKGWENIIKTSKCAASFGRFTIACIQCYEKNRKWIKSMFTKRNPITHYKFLSKNWKNIIKTGKRAASFGRFITTSLEWYEKNRERFKSMLLKCDLMTDRVSKTDEEIAMDELHFD